MTMLAYGLAHTACSVAALGYSNADFRAIYGDRLDAELARECWRMAFWLSVFGPASLLISLLPPMPRGQWTLSGSVG